MNASADTQLVEELDRLRHQNRGLKRATVVSLLVGAGLCLFSRGLPDTTAVRIGLVVLAISFAIAALLLERATSRSRVLEAQVIILRGEAPNPRAVLGVNSDGTIGLHLWDTEGHRRAVIGLDNSGCPGFACFDQVTSEVRLRTGGHPATRDSQRVSQQGIRLWLGVNADRAAGINVIDQHGETIFAAP